MYEFTLSYFIILLYFIISAPKLCGVGPHFFSGPFMLNMLSHMGQIHIKRVIWINCFAPKLYPSLFVLSLCLSTYFEEHTHFI